MAFATFAGKPFRWARKPVIMGGDHGQALLGNQPTKNKFRSKSLWNRRLSWQ